MFQNWRMSPMTTDTQTAQTVSAFLFSICIASGLATDVVLWMGSHSMPLGGPLSEVAA